jgi:hypothetical protein
MQLLLSLKSYENYFSLLLANKKGSEWEAALQNMKENKQLEKCFLERMAEENEISNINFTIYKLWTEFRKNILIYERVNNQAQANYNLNKNLSNLNNLFSSLGNLFNTGSGNSNSETNNVSNAPIISSKPPKPNLGNYPLILLIDVMEVFYTANGFTIIYLQNEINKHFANLFLLIFVKSIKYFKCEEKYLKKLINFIIFFIEKRENIEIYLEEILKNDGLHTLFEKIKYKVKINLRDRNKFLNMGKNNFYENVHENLQKQKIPFQWKVSEM